jgi:hypothetical protein
MNKLITIMAVLLLTVGVAFADGGDYVDLTPCTVIGNNNPVCTGNRDEVVFKGDIMSFESADLLMSKEEYLSDEETIAHLLERIESLEKAAQVKTKVYKDRGYSILVPDVRYVGTDASGNDKYCYPLDTGVIGDYDWSCE